MLMYRKDPLPDIQRLEQLVDSIRRGEIRLPKFQRPFVWEREDILDLWDSVYNGYPIGSVLLWHSSERLKSEREILGFSFQESPAESYPTDYLLDGQQRLTTVCGALYWDGVNLDSLWAIHFDLDTEKFVYAKNKEQINLFPLNKLLNTSDFIKQCMKFESTATPKKYYERAEELLKAFKDYKVAVVKIGDVSLDEVAPIFERINSTGRKLTMVDLMRAATWREGFDLTGAIISFSESLNAAGFSEVPETAILRGVAAAAGLGINKGDIDHLRDLSVDDLKRSFASSEKSTLAALDFLKTHAGVDDVSMIPYAIQLTHLAEMFRINPKIGQERSDELNKWFWFTSITRYFGGASTGQNSRDLLDARDFATGKQRALGPAIEKTNLSDFIFDDFNLRTATSTAFCLLLRKSNPRTNINGLRISTPPPHRKNRRDYIDIFKGSAYEGLNVGQALRGMPVEPNEWEAVDLKGNFLTEISPPIFFEQKKLNKLKVGPLFFATKYKIFWA